MTPTIYTPGVEKSRSATGAMVLDKRRVCGIKTMSSDKMEIMSQMIRYSTNFSERIEGGCCERTSTIKRCKNNQEDRKVNKNKHLLDIALRTIKLVQRNRTLQRQLSQLQLETNEFMASVLENPENKKLSQMDTELKSGPSLQPSAN